MIEVMNCREAAANEQLTTIIGPQEPQELRIEASAEPLGDKPKVVIHRLCSYGLQLDLYNVQMPDQYTLANESPIAEICHKMKNLFSDGEADGKTCANKKLKSGESLQNNSIRMCLAYTFSQYWDGEIPVTQIVFMHHSRKDFTPYRQTIRFVEKKGKIKPRIEVVGELSEAEIASYENVFLSAAAYELQAYLDNVYAQAKREQVKPDYFLSIQ